MQADAVSHYHWMTGGQFLNAVALGQITPGPVVGVAWSAREVDPPDRLVQHRDPEQGQGLEAAS
jgi:hypothetical protein